MTYPQPSSTELLTQFDSALTNAWDKVNLSEKRISALYELYILKLVIEAAKRSKELRSVQYRIPEQSTPLSAWNIMFRTGPHQIFDDSYCYAELCLAERRFWEVHVGTKFRGKSDVEHEADIAILSKRAAQRFRQSRISPDYNSLIFAAECKFYSSSIGLDMSREFLGLTNDITAPKRRNFYITCSRIVQNGVQLLDNHDRRHYDVLIPRNVLKKEQFQEELAQIFSR